MLVSLVKIGKLPHKFSEACNFPSRLSFYCAVPTRGNISGARKTPQSCKTWGMFWIFSLQTPANERLRVCQFSQSEDQRSVSHLADDDLWSLKPVLSHDAPSVWVWVGTQCSVTTVRCCHNCTTHCIHSLSDTGPDGEKLSTLRVICERRVAVSKTRNVIDF